MECPPPSVKFLVPEKFRDDTVWVNDALLRAAARSGNADQVLRMLRAGVPADGPADQDPLEYILHAGGRTALFHALSADCLRTAALLLDAGASPLRITEDGEGVLDAWYASVRSRAMETGELGQQEAEMLDRLLMAGASVGLPSAHGWTLADQIDRDLGVDWLERQRAMIQAKKIDQATPVLHSARPTARL